MGMEASAIIEHWEHTEPPDGTRRYSYWGEYHVPHRGVALQLYALSGLDGGDPGYELKDLSFIGASRYEKEQDIVASNPIKIEGSQVREALRRVNPPKEVHGPLRIALEAVEKLGPHARLVFWMTI